MNKCASNTRDNLMPTNPNSHLRSIKKPPQKIILILKKSKSKPPPVPLRGDLGVTHLLVFEQLYYNITRAPLIERCSCYIDIYF